MSTPSPSVAATVVAPLYLAGFTTAFGAHGVAAALGVRSDDVGLTLLSFGAVLALYDVAEVLLKPLFGALSDRVGVKRLVVGGLLAFAAVSLLGAVLVTPAVLALARLGQGAAASAFSPASSAAVARLAGPGAAGRYFGRYGAWKSLGYAVGPLLGAGLLAVGGMRALFVTLTVLAAGAAVWAAVALPPIAVLPRPRATVADVVRQVADPTFLVPTAVLAAATAALGVAVGFLPLVATRAGLDPVASMAAVTVLALASTVVQPVVGRLRDAGHVDTRRGAPTGLALVTAGTLLVAVAPHAVTVYAAALLVGLGIGVATPLAFAHLAASTPAERMGRTMGAAELGREIGDAGGPLLVGAVAVAVSLPVALGSLAVVTAGTAAVGAVALRPRPSRNP
ncbi:MFS transporter [Cellulomonas sp.]|uniref:MFS transporter n=1 Tax=Cellulomonas sp. TaxID=40001 RepID=UPI0025C0E8CE|nr:MFS transporter [Cellulomonas sp.]